MCQNKRVLETIYCDGHPVPIVSNVKIYNYISSRRQFFMTDFDMWENFAINLGMRFSRYLNFYDNNYFQP